MGDWFRCGLEHAIFGVELFEGFLTALVALFAATLAAGLLTTWYPFPLRRWTLGNALCAVAAAVAGAAANLHFGTDPMFCNGML